MTGKVHHRGTKPRGVFEGRKALDIAHGIYRAICGKPGERIVVVVNADNEVYAKPEWSAVVKRVEREHPERIAGYYQTARNLRAIGITPQSIADDIMAVIGRKVA